MCLFRRSRPQSRFTNLVGTTTEGLMTPAKAMKSIMTLNFE